MTSNGDRPLNASNKCAAVDGRPRSPRSPRQAPRAASSSSKENHPQLHHGDDDDHDDGPNESEAETVVLGSRNGDSPPKRLIKTERDAGSHSPLGNGRHRSSPGHDCKTNGAKHGSDSAKSPVPTSPSSRTTSRHTKDTSPDSNKSPAQPVRSPTQTVRGRSASTADTRKRKSRDDSYPKTIEPPRQKARTDGLRDSRQSNSPATPGFAHSQHRRSQSTQSVVTGVAARKRREVTSLALSAERWSDDSSEHSSPAGRTPNPVQSTHTRLKRGSTRTLTSPARTLPKNKTDKFGATRLARESERGDLDEVKEAYEDAPEELNQADYAGIAPLQKASLNGWANVVEFLISKGCNTDCESENRDTPLIDAVENSHLKVVRLLLNEGHVNPHHSNKKGQRAIDVLDHENDDADEIEKELRAAMRRETNRPKEKQPDRRQAKTAASRLLYNEFNVETLIEKAGDGDILAVGELINSNIKPNITCGVAAARGGHYDILSILLASGLKADPDPSKHPETPMTVAIGRGHLKIIQLLLEQDGFNPTRRNKENKTYYEIAEEKAGPRWEQERDVLKQAYDEHRGTHRSPRRAKKEPPSLSAIRMKRRGSLKRDRSTSPRPDARRAHLTKSETAPSAPPQKSRRLMSGKEMANREGKRRKRIVEDDEDSSEEESEEDVRPPIRKIKPRSHSEGEENKPTKKPLKARSDDNDTVKRKIRSHSGESDEDPASKLPTKPRTKVFAERPNSAKPTPEVDSPDERKPVKNKIKYKMMDDKPRKRKLSDASIDDRSVKQTPTVSAKSTPAPPERIATPEVERERRQEEQRLEAEARQRAAEAVAEVEARRKAEEGAAREAAELEDARKQADADAEAQRQAEEAEAARRKEEEEKQRRADEEARQEEMRVARQDRISKLPRALRLACELGTNRPLHFTGAHLDDQRLGISSVYLPIYYATAGDLQDPLALPDKTYICSLQLVGILGLPELDLAYLSSPYSEWPRIPLSQKQRVDLLRQYDVAMLAQDFKFPTEGHPDFDYAKIHDSIKEVQSQFLALDLYWVEESLLHAEVEKCEVLQTLLPVIKEQRVRASVYGNDRPRRSFVDLLKEQT
jgi:ankyrin repeat protein